MLGLRLRQSPTSWGSAMSIQVWTLHSPCGCFTWNTLYCNLYPIAFGVEDDTFVIPVAGGSWLPHYLDSVTGHLLGEAIHFFF